MAKFLNTTGTSYHLEELIKTAKERLILISPYLQFSDRIKELLEDKDRLKIDVRIVYGKTELKPAEINWLKELSYIRTSFCKNLHAKCYLNEEVAIITSLNLYEFSQVNNNEMGVLIDKRTDSELYIDTYEEVQRIIRMSDEVRLSVDVIRDNSEKYDNTPVHKNPPQPTPPNIATDTLTIAKLATHLGLKTKALESQLIDMGYLMKDGDNLILTALGTQFGDIKKGRFGDFIVWQIAHFNSLSFDKNA